MAELGGTPLTRHLVAAYLGPPRAPQGLELGSRLRAHHMGRASRAWFLLLLGSASSLSPPTRPEPLDSELEREPITIGVGLAIAGIVLAATSMGVSATVLGRFGKP